MPQKNEIHDLRVIASDALFELEKAQSVFQLIFEGLDDDRYSAVSLPDTTPCMTVKRLENYINSLNVVNSLLFAAMALMEEVVL